MSKYIALGIVGAVLVITLAILAKSCSQQPTINSLQLENQALRTLINTKNQTIYEQDVIITDNQQAIHQLTDSIFSLSRKHEKEIKRVIAYYKGTTITKLDSVLIPYLDSASLSHKDSLIEGCRKVMQYMADSFIFVPRRVEKVTPSYRFAGTVLKEGFRIDSLSIPDTLQLRFVEKGGFLRKRTTSVQFFHSNPLITTTQANSVIYHPQKRGRWVERAIAVGLGIFIGSKL